MRWLTNAPSRTGAPKRERMNAGARRIAGFGPDAGNIKVQAEAGQLHFVRQQVSPLAHMPSSIFTLVSEAEGRRGVLQAVLLVPEP